MTHEQEPEIYRMPPDVPEEMWQSINFLRQYLNERTSKELLSNADLWHWLRSGIGLTYRAGQEDGYSRGLTHQPLESDTI